MRIKYKFSHRSDDGLYYYWISSCRIAGDSRHLQVRCRVDWFWRGPDPAKRRPEFVMPGVHVGGEPAAD